MEEKRAKKFERVIRQRQFNLSILLENVHDNHNIGAVLRSCDSVGIVEIFILNTDPKLQKRYISVGKKTSSGARKWVNVNYYTDADLCFNAINKNYTNIWATHLSEEAKSLYDLDLTEPTIFVFGNENEGITQDTLDRCTGNFVIPQMGMTESLNISVACAVTVYEAARQRIKANFYDGTKYSKKQYDDITAEYLERHKIKAKRRYVSPKGQADYKKDIL